MSEVNSVRGRVLVVDDENAMRIALSGLLRKEGYEVETAPSAEAALALVETGGFHAVITDLSMSGMSGLDLLGRIRAIHPDIAVIMITAYGSEKVAVQAMKAGAADYIPKPFDNDEMRIVVARVVETVRLKREHRLLLEQVQGQFAFENILGRTPAIERVFRTIDRVADTDITVLIRGESGTGKELIAGALHYRSPRRGKPLIKMNCAALSRELVESELFGHERGAFTGATARREGKFEAAHGGSLFLDEVGDMPLETQAKLLRAIQEKEFERVGGNVPIRVDVRLIAATHHDLETAVAQGRFREDLYYRLRVVELPVPRLAERRDDIPLLADHFLREAAQRYSRPLKQLTGAALRACLEHAWPGNVRELRSRVEQALLLAPGDEIEVNDLFDARADHRSAARSEEHSENRGDPTTSAADVAASLTFREAKERMVATFEREFLSAALRRNNGNITKAAEETGMYRQNFQQKMRELGMHGDDEV